MRNKTLERYLLLGEINPVKIFALGEINPGKIFALAWK